MRFLINNVADIGMKVAHNLTDGLFIPLPDPVAPDPYTRVEMTNILETQTNPGEFAPKTGEQTKPAKPGRGKCAGRSV